MRLISFLLILLACRAHAGFPGCPECDEGRARLSKHGPDAAAAALLGSDGPYAEDRLVELGARAVPSLLKQFAGPKCAGPGGSLESLTEAQEEVLFAAERCERLTAKALAAVLCDSHRPIALRSVALVSKRLDVRLMEWLPLTRCTPEVLDVLAPRMLALVGAQRPLGPYLEHLAPLGERALPAVPWAVAALGEDHASQVPALHLLEALGRSAKEAWPAVAGLVKSPNASVSGAALHAAVRLGEPEQFEPLLGEAISRAVAEDCWATYNLLQAWPRGGGGRLAEAATLVLRSCKPVRVDAAGVLRELGAGPSHLADLLFVLRDERRPLRERASLAQLLLSDEWEPPLRLAAADEAYAQRLMMKGRVGEGRFSTNQVLPQYEPSPWLELQDVDICRTEAGLAPLDGGWPIEGADRVAMMAATRCLSERWCGPTRATFVQAIAACCAGFDASVPAWCAVP